jgi:hypothetical protein
MSEERQKVLEMLAEGRLTPEQADRLLEALGTAGQGAQRPQPEPRPGRTDNPQQRFLSGLTADQLIKMRQHGVNPDFIQEIRGLGFTDLNVDQLIKMRIHGVGPDFIEEMRGLGFSADVDALIKLRNHGVNAEFVQEMQELGFDRLPADQLVKLRTHGVTPDFIREMRDLGFTDDDVDELVKLRIHGVNGDFVRKMRELAEQQAFRVNAAGPVGAKVETTTPVEPHVEDVEPVWTGPVA